MPFAQFERLYEQAHAQGLKGCTVFRPNPLRGEILAAAPPPQGGRCCDADREAD
jgi:ribonucleoside-diphosphate reductase alpha chain